MRNTIRIIGNASLVLASILLTVAAVEVVLHHTNLRGYIPGNLDPGYYSFNAEERMTDITPNFATTTMYFRDGQVEIWSNNVGCFDTHIEPGTTPYILLLGDSFTWGYAPFEYKWGTILQEKLGVRVAKCGVAGYGTKKELIKGRAVMERVGDPALIVVGYYANDISDDAWVSFKQPGTSQRCPEAYINPLNKIKCWLRTYSVLANILRSELGESGNPALRGLADEIFLTPVHGPGEKEAQREAHNQTIADFLTLAREHNAPILFVLIPPKNTLTKAANPLTEANENTRVFLEERGVPVLDLLPLFESAYAESSTPLYWRHDAHLNVAGNALVADLVAEFVTTHALIETDNR